MSAIPADHPLHHATPYPATPHGDDGIQGTTFAHWQEMGERAPYSLIFCKPDQTTVWVNKAFEAISGYALADIVGKKPSAVLQCQLTDAITRTQLRTALDAGQPVHTEVLNRAKDGRLYWVDLAIDPIKDATGQLIGFFSIQIDVTAQVMERRRLAATFNSQSMGFLVLDAQGTLIDCNDYVARMIALPIDRIKGQALEAFQAEFHKPDGTVFKKDDRPLWRAVQTGAHLDKILAGMFRADGSRLWLTVSTQWIDPALGREGGTLATLFDVTDRVEHRRRLEKANSDAQKNLAELQTYRSALDQHTIVSITDARGNIVFVNRRFCEISGYSLEELLGHDHSLIQSPNNPSSYFADLWATISSGTTWRGEICNRAKNGTLFWVDSTIAPVLNHEGEIDQYIAIFYDITHRRLAERHLRESRERFKSLLAMSSDWYWESDTEHRITLLSEGIDHTGLNHATIMGKFLWNLEIDREDKNWAVHRATVKAWGDFSNFEFRIKNPKPGATPAWLWLSISGRPMHNSSGVTVGYRGVGRDVTSRRFAQDQLWDLANLDPLTGLPNRMRFNDALTHAATQAQQLQQPFALALIDLDNFKEVNDSMGHDVGDELLCAVATRLSKALRGNDMIARIGGDEFGVLIHGLGSGSGLARPLDAMMASMNEPIEIGGQLRRCNLSMGVTLYPSDSTETANLIKNADIALYRAKAAGRGQYVMFHPELKSDVDRTATLMHEIEAALEQNQLLLHYQPVVDVSRGTVVGLEALLRWQHPTRGLMTAGAFTQVFDNMGVAARMGHLVTQLALQQIALWVSEGVAFGKVAINVSAGDFLLGAFPTSLATQLERHKVSPKHFGVEVTEGMFLGRTAFTVLDGINRLHGMGIEVSFDDFGTGYASLMHLKLPIDRLKIDRSFVHDIDTQTTDAHTNAAIVQAVTDLGRRLGKGITVEGVETESQLRRLTDMGCTQFQGNHFSLPLPADEVPAFIKQFNLQYRTPSDFPALNI